VEIKLEKLKYHDAQQLLRFEQENRTYFEKMVPSRGDGYYCFNTFKVRHQSLLEEQKMKESYFYLIKDIEGVILGRMNLVDIDLSQNSAYIGYRVGQKFTGQGIAIKAVRLLLEDVDNLGISKIFAKTTTNNIGSQKVLEKTGFKKRELSDEGFIMNGEHIRFVNYLWTT